MSQKTILTGFFLAFLLMLTSACCGIGCPPERENPIEYIGHGALFDKDGNEIQVTVELIEEAHEFYLNTLLAKADESQSTLFEQKQETLFAEREWDTRSELYAESALIQWLIREIQPTNASRPSGILKLLQQKLMEPSFQVDASVDSGASLFELPGELTDLLNTTGLAGTGGEISNIAFFATTLSGTDYLNKCNNAGVPTPPDWGTSQWEYQGILTDIFIGQGYDTTKVYTYESSNPQGMCIALPRSNGNIIGLLGIICLGKTSSNACFWDNQRNDQNYSIQKGTVVPISRFAGGAELDGGSGGTCTDCHAGENPYVIHPKTALGLPSLSGLPLKADNWYNPLVHPNWPQNSNPSNISGACAECHTQAGTGGRFPELSTQLPGYCSDVLRNAINRTMPEGNPGNIDDPNDPNDDAAIMAYAAHSMALLEACDRPPASSQPPPEPSLAVLPELIGFSLNNIEHAEAMATEQGPSIDSRVCTETDFQNAHERPWERVFLLQRTGTVPSEVNLIDFVSNEDGTFRIACFGELSQNPTGQEWWGIIEMRPSAPRLESYTGEILIDSNSGQNMIQLFGFFLDSASQAIPRIEFSPHTVTSGLAPIGGNVEQMVEIENVGTGLLTISEIGIVDSNTQPSAFSQSILSGLPLDLAPGASTEILIRFSPSQESDMSAKLMVATNAMEAGNVGLESDGQGTYWLPLFGSGFGCGDIEVSPAYQELLFVGEANPNQSLYPSQQVFIYNFGICTVSLQNVFISDSTFSVTPFVLEVEPGAIGTINVEFRPPVGTVCDAIDLCRADLTFSYGFQEGTNPMIDHRIELIANVTDE